MRLFVLFLGGLALAGVALAQDVAPGDPASGKKLAGMCRTCHGLDGISRIPQAPHIAGQPEGYLAAQLAAFHSGARSQEMMTIVTQALTDTQIADLAAWYASQTFTATMRADPANAPETCASCHGADGVAVAEGVPNLAGYAFVYTLAQLKAFKDGSRASDIMQPIAAELDDAQMRAVTDWYAAVKVKPAP